MEKIKLYFLNNKKVFIIIGCILSIAISSIGCYFYYQYMNRNKVIVDNILSNDFENNFIDNVKDNDLINNDNTNIGTVDVNKDSESNNNSQDILNSKEELIEYIYVDIKGYVNKPGVYKFVKTDNKRIDDLIKQAGGLKKDANTSVINLSTKLKDEMVVIIYSNKELEDFIKTKESLKDKLEICDKEEVKNDGCITEDDVDNKFESNAVFVVQKLNFQVKGNDKDE